MPFAGPERALAATIGIVSKVKLHPPENGARWSFLALREFNHFHEDSTT
jgi:hypothetical protein